MKLLSHNHLLLYLKCNLKARTSLSYRLHACFLVQFFAKKAFLKKENQQTAVCQFLLDIFRQIGQELLKGVLVGLDIAGSHENIDSIVVIK